MYLASITIENFRCFGEGPKRFHLELGRGLTALTGENDSGKTAVIDALRYLLGTRDQEWNPVSDADFNDQAEPRELTITCKFEELDATEKRAFLKYLTYEGEQPVLYLNWTAKDVEKAGKRRSYRKTETHSGKHGDGPLLASEVREMLRTTYLRPLHDAQEALSAGRGSRLSQVLQHTQEIRTTGVPYDPATPNVDPKMLNDSCSSGHS